MASNDNIEYPQRGYDTKDVKAMEQQEQRPKKRRWALKAILYLLLLPIAVLALWTWGALTYAYSRGDRVGYAQKLSKKGWICPTWEGELAMSNVPGQMPEKFEFSVRDDALARQIQSLDGRRVALSYEQHRGVPFSCFGETQYFVNGVRPADGLPMPGAPAGAPGAPTTAPATTPPATTPPATTPPATPAPTTPGAPPATTPTTPAGATPGATPPPPPATP
jgi:hypothetical protein